MINYSNYLPNNLKKEVRNTCISNPYFAHPENILLAMLFDTRQYVREMAFERILAIRSEGEDGDYGSVRPFEVANINFDADEYYNLFRWEYPYTEPPFTRTTFTYDELVELKDSNAFIIDDIKQIQCHIQGTERHVKLVTEASRSTSTHERRESVMLATLESREKRPKFDSKKDFV